MLDRGTDNIERRSQQQGGRLVELLCWCCQTHQGALVYGMTSTERVLTSSVSAVTGQCRSVINVDIIHVDVAYSWNPAEGTQAHSPLQNSLACNVRKAQIQLPAGRALLVCAAAIPCHIVLRECVYRYVYQLRQEGHEAFSLHCLQSGSALRSASNYSRCGPCGSLWQRIPLSSDDNRTQQAQRSSWLLTRGVWSIRVLPTPQQQQQRWVCSIALIPGTSRCSQSIEIAGHAGGSLHALQPLTASTVASMWTLLIAPSTSPLPAFLPLSTAAALLTHFSFLFGSWRR